MLPNILVVGGNGFLGSSICRVAVKKGWKVTSISSSGQPFRTPKGHSPAWTSQVDWHAASAFEPTSYSSLVGQSTAVVHTIGTLFENTSYKQAIRTGNLAALLQIISGSDAGSNPLNSSNSWTSYQSLNHDSAMMVLNTFLSTKSANTTPENPSTRERAFVYISAEDIFSPLVPRGYITSKRAAERDIALACLHNPGARVRTVSLRPSLMYHPHLRPLTTPLATLLSASAQGHKFIRSKIQLPIPTPAGILETLASRLESSSSKSQFAPTSNPLGQGRGEGEDSEEQGSWLTTALRSSANALQIPPMHVDHVALAACTAIERERPLFSPGSKNTLAIGDRVHQDADAEDEGKNVVLGVSEMRELIGWRWGDESASHPCASYSTGTGHSE